MHFAQNIHAPSPDPEMNTQQYERTKLQNQMLGIPEISVSGPEATKKERDRYDGIGSPMAKHRRHQELIGSPVRGNVASVRCK